MSDLIIADKSDLKNIANAIREKTSKNDEMYIYQMANEIRGISSGSGNGICVLAKSSKVYVPPVKKCSIFINAPDIYATSTITISHAIESSVSVISSDISANDELSMIENE